MKRPDGSVDAYVDSITGSLRAQFDTVRALVEAAVPGASASIRYGMLNYPDLCSLAAQKHYVALYVDPEVVDRFRDQLGDLDCGRSCLRFKVRDTVPVTVITAILQARAARQGAT